MIKDNDLNNYRILVIGAGGLGCPVIDELSKVGVRQIDLIDGDIISQSNLDRQFLFSQNDIGKFKVNVAQLEIKKQYPATSVKPIQDFLSIDNAIGTIHEYDVVFDCSDNFPTRYLVSDVCVLLRKNLFMGAVNGNEGQVFSFINHEVNSAFYRDLFPNSPSPSEIISCNQSNVSVKLLGKIGKKMVEKFITSIVKLDQINELIYYNIEFDEFINFSINANEILVDTLPKSTEELRRMNYQIQCYGDFTIRWSEIEKIKGNYCLLDIREKYEEPKFVGDSILNYSVDEILEGRMDLNCFDEIYVVCQNGSRSKSMAHYLRAKFPNKTVCSIFGGLMDCQSPIF